MKKISKLAISIPSTALAVAGVTTGITSCNNNDNYWLEKNKEVLKTGDISATVTAYHNGSAYTGSWNLDDDTYATISNGVVTLKQAPNNETRITINETTHNLSTTITLLPDKPVPVENYWLTKDKDTLKMGVDTNTAMVTAHHNDSTYIGNWSLSDDTYATIGRSTGEIILTNAPSPDPIVVTIIENSQPGLTTTITLLPNDPEPNNYWLSVQNDRDTLKGTGDETTVVAHHNDSTYTGIWEVSANDYATIGETTGVIILNKAPSSACSITITETTHNLTTTITLLPGEIEKEDISDILTNTVVMDGNVTDNVNSLNEGNILDYLKEHNPGLKTEHLKFSLNTPPYHDETMPNDINFWYLTIDTSDSEFYKPGNVTINVINETIPLSEYIRNIDLGTLKVESNGGTVVGGNGPEIADIKNKIKIRNPNINQDFIDKLTWSENCDVEDYEYTNTITCNIRDYPFISSNNTVDVQFCGIEENHFAAKKGNSWIDDFDEFQYYNNEGEPISGATSGGLIPNDSLGFTSESNEKENKIFMEDGRNSIDKMIFMSGWNYDRTRFSYKGYGKNYHRPNDSDTLDISGMNLTFSQPPTNSPAFNVSAFCANKLITGDHLLESINFKFYYESEGSIPLLPNDVEKPINIYSTRMTGITVLSAAYSSGAHMFYPPKINLHLPYGSKYSVSFRGDYVSSFTVIDYTHSSGVTFGPGGTYLAPEITTVYDYNGNVPIDD